MNQGVWEVEAGGQRKPGQWTFLMMSTSPVAAPAPRAQARVLRHGPFSQGTDFYLEFRHTSTTQYWNDVNVEKDIFIW